jgi:predicted  nucleic acid-binding Zn-ribbon protein
MPEANKSRLERRLEAAKISVGDQIIANGTADDDVVRCNRCGAVLTAARSIDLELGPVCRHREAGERG